MSKIYKVRISAKLAGDWRSRSLDEDGGLPNCGGVHEFTEAEAVAMVRFLKAEIEDYRDNEMPDFHAAAKRQLATFKQAWLDSK